MCVMTSEAAMNAMRTTTYQNGNTRMSTADEGVAVGIAA
jgi:hypothetical protein